MPITCQNDQAPRFRVKKINNNNIRLAFCGDKVVEAKKLKEKALNKK